MAMYDWNKNGIKDFGDDYIEYQIYKDTMGEQDDPPKLPKSKNKSIFESAKTTDGKEVDGYDINGWIVLLGILIAILAWVFLVKGIKASNRGEDLVSFLWMLSSLAAFIFGKWLLMGKRVIKKDRQKKYGIVDEEKHNDHN